jgi:hypothetical protein
VAWRVAEATLRMAIEAVTMLLKCTIMCVECVVESKLSSFALNL